MFTIVWTVTMMMMKTIVIRKFSITAKIMFPLGYQRD